MKEIDIIVDRQKMYRLFEDENGSQCIGVLCGGVAMYELKLKLSQSELLDYKNGGKSYLDGLAINILRQPGLYECRAF